VFTTSGTYPTVDIQSHNFQTKLSIDIEADNFIGGGNRRVQTKPLTNRRSPASFLIHSSWAGIEYHDFNSGDIHWLHMWM